MRLFLCQLIISKVLHFPIPSRYNNTLLFNFSFRWPTNESRLKHGPWREEKKTRLSTLDRNMYRFPRVEIRDALASQIAIFSSVFHVDEMYQAINWI